MSGPISARDTVHIATPRGKVWEALLAELAGAGRWWAVTNSFEASGPPGEMGTEIAWTVRPNGGAAPGPVLRFSSVTLAVVPGERLDLEMRGVFDGRAVFRLSDCRDGRSGTVLSFDFDVEARGWVRALHRFVDVSRGHSNGVQEAFARLRLLLEDGASPAVARWERVRCGAAWGMRRVSRQTSDYGDELEVCEWRAGDADAEAPTAVLLHGWGASGRAYDIVLEHLLRAGMRVVIPDLPGHGGSHLAASGRLTLERIAAVVRSVVDRFGTERTVVVAHSGAGLATVIALPDCRGVTGLVLLGVAFQDPGASRPALALQGSPLLTAALRDGRLAEALLSRAMGPSTPTPTRALTAARLRSVRPDIRRRYFEASRGVDLRRFAHRIPCPTVMLVGDEDKTVSPTAARASALEVPEVAVQTVPYVGHALPEEAPQAVAAATLSLVR